MRLVVVLSLLVALAVAGCGASQPASRTILLATTTSTQDSGLLDVLIPDFERKTGYRVKTSAVGTGAALAIGARGDADFVLVHAPSSAQRRSVSTETPRTSAAWPIRRAGWTFLGFFARIPREMIG